MKEILDYLSTLVNLLGVPAILLLIALLLAAILYSTYMLLSFGENALHLLVPFIREYIEAIRNELKIRKDHPALRLELWMHFLCALVLLLCIAAVILHALIPWVPEHTHHTILSLIIGASVVMVILAFPSFSIAMRSKE